MLKSLVLAMGLLFTSQSMAAVYSSICLGNEYVGQAVSVDFRYGEVGAVNTAVLYPGEWRTFYALIEDEDYEEYFYVTYDENRSVVYQPVTEILESALTYELPNCDDSYAYEFRWDAIQSLYISLYSVL